MRTTVAFLAKDEASGGGGAPTPKLVLRVWRTVLVLAALWLSVFGILVDVAADSMASTTWRPSG